MKCHGEVLNNEMIWDESTGDNDTVEQPGVYETGTLYQGRCDLHNESNDKSMTTKIDNEFEDPVQCCYRVGREIMLETVGSAFNEINEKRLRNLCLSSVLGIVVQMKLSGAARKSAMYLFQGSLTLTLATLAVGTFSTIELKRSICAILAECDEKEKEIIVSSKKLDALKNVFKLLKEKFQMDTQFRRRWQGSLGMIVLYYFCRQRQAVKIITRYNQIYSYDGRILQSSA